MLEAGQIRELLILDLAVKRGLVESAAAESALRAAFAKSAGTGVSILAALERDAGLGDAALGPVLAEVDQRIAASEGDAALALTRTRGLDKSICRALVERGPLGSMAPASGGDASGVALRSLPGDRYLDFIPVGEGGMGVVYMALDTELNRLVAFKMVRAEGWDGEQAATPFTRIEAHAPEPDSEDSEGYEELRARFLQEAWVTGGLEHPGVVPVYELGQTTGGVPYYTMRFVGGQKTLKDALDGVKEAHVEERLALLEPFLKLCDTVRYAHSRGVIHRDLKPDNVALGEFGEVVLLDWGLAKLEDSEELRDTHWQERVKEYRDAGALQTVAGAIGTPGYMAPEAVLGAPEDVDLRCDVYSLGVILFEILAGRRPLEFKNYAEFLSGIKTQDAPSALSLSADVPEALSDLCAQCLSRERTERPADVEALAQAIRSWQTTSALEREVDGHLREAKAALGAAEAASAGARLTQVDRAAVALAQAASKMPERPEIAEYQAQGEHLREEGIREREKASGRRLLMRVGVFALVIVALAGYVIAAKFEARSLQRQRDLQRILRLAASKKLGDLEREVATFSASQPDLVERTGAWLERADELVALEPEHERALAELRASAVSKVPRLSFVSAELEWQHQVLSDLVASLAALKESDSGVRKTVIGLQGLADEIRETMRASEQKWADTIAAVSRHPEYAGLELTVQHGLVPLGSDPDSGLFEFAHLGSGRLPVRDPVSRRLVYGDDAGIVLVLIPAGTFLMGAQATQEDGPNFDPLAAEPEGDKSIPTVIAAEGPVHTKSVGPFLLAKHECTQRQWHALTPGVNPSFFASGGRYPVEQVSWEDCVKWLGRHGLELPTETQWEYACRAGTNTPWWLGAVPEAMVDVAWTAEHTQTQNPKHETIMRGNTKPVGVLRANAFGLHDVHGNVWEWCSNLIHRYDEPLPDVMTYGGYRVIRGGSWYEEVENSRSAQRAPDLPDYRCFHLGVRPARNLTTK